MYKKVLYIIGVAMMTLQSCTDGFMEEYSQDLKRVQTADDLNELLMGDCLLPLAIFNYNYSYSTENENFMVLHFMGDELQETLNLPQDPDGFQITEKYYPYFTWQADCSIDYKGASTLAEDEETFWNLAYEKINKCNMVLDAADKLSTPKKEDQELKERVIGECHFLRANYYYMLANLYGKPYAPSTAASTPCVPIKNTSYIEDISYMRNSVAEVYAQIIADLDAAEEKLKDATAPASIYHAGIGAVYIFRSRIALYMQNWDEAKTYSELALAHNDFLLNMCNWNPDAYPLSSSNNEVIYSNGASCFGNAVYHNPKRKSSYNIYAPVYSVSDHLVNLYDRKDGRRSGYITDKDDISQGNWSYHKIDNSSDGWNTYKTVSDVFCLRTAEAYLNMAEAEAQLGNNETACRYLNKLRRSRISDVDDVSLNGSELITFIREERERELCFEGHRWFDLRRYQTDTNYPFSKVIEHTMTWYINVNYEDIPSFTNYYRLEEYDEAYTLNIPKNVREFQNSIGSNIRPDRNVIDTKTYSRGDDDDDDWDDDWDW